MKHFCRLAAELAVLSFVTFILLSFLDDLLPGFVSLYFSPAIFLAGAVAMTATWLGLMILYKLRCV